DLRRFQAAPGDRKVLHRPLRLRPPLRLRRDQHLAHGVAFDPEPAHPPYRALPAATSATLRSEGPRRPQLRRSCRPEGGRRPQRRRRRRFRGGQRSLPAYDRLKLLLTSGKSGTIVSVKLTGSAGQLKNDGSTIRLRVSVWSS